MMTNEMDGLFDGLWVRDNRGETRLESLKLLLLLLVFCNTGQWKWTVIFVCGVWTVDRLLLLTTKRLRLRASGTELPITVNLGKLVNLGNIHPFCLLLTSLSNFRLTFTYFDVQLPTCPIIFV
jgi:hypothetical protein